MSAFPPADAAYLSQPPVGSDVLAGEMPLFPKAEEMITLTLNPAVPVSKVKMGLKVLRDLELRSYVKNHLRMMAVSPDFTDVAPPAPEMDEAYEEYAQSLEEWGQLQLLAKAATARKKQARKRLEKLMVARGGYVQEKSRGNAAKIKGVGLGVTADASPVGALMPPGNFRSELGVVQGQMLLNWDAVKGALSYMVEVSSNVQPREFRLLRAASKTSLLLTDLPVGETLVFRIGCLGGGNRMSPWSMELIRCVG